MSYIKELIGHCEQALRTEPERSFLMKDLSDLEGIKTAIYVVELTSGDPEKIFLDFVAYRNKSDRACAKLNAPSNTLYVGSSTTGVKNRIRQHLGDGHRRTSALHLQKWCEGNYQIRVLVYPSIKQQVLQIVEDSMSHELKPAFGKSGPNNK